MLFSNTMTGVAEGLSRRSNVSLHAGAFVLLVAAIGCSADSGGTSGRSGGSPNGGGPGTGGTGATGTGGSSAGGSGGDGSGATGGVSGSSGVGGAAGATGGTSGAGAGGTMNVTFEWKETAPGTEQCIPGRYFGAAPAFPPPPVAIDGFVGTFAPSAIIIPAPIPVSGDVDLVLTESVSGEFLEISDGHVKGMANNAHPYEADLTGRVNCITLKLENGYLRNGWYQVVAGAGQIQYPFEGPVSADYDAVKHAFVNGKWSGTEPVPPVGTYGGSGTWAAKYCPNGPPC